MIGNGTGEWDVPVGGMGALTDELVRCAAAAGAELATGAEATAIEADATRAHVRVDGRAVACDHVVAPARRPCSTDCSAGRSSSHPRAQLKVNMLLSRFPRLRDPSVPAEEAFAGTFHVNETYAQLEAAYEDASDGLVLSPVPCEIYCYSLTDPSILGPGVEAYTLTLFAPRCPRACSMPTATHRRARRSRRLLRSLDSVLAEPIEEIACCARRRASRAWSSRRHRPRARRRSRAGTSSTATSHGRSRTRSRPAAGGPRPGSPTSTSAAPVRAGAAASAGIPGRNAAMAILRSEG